MSKLYLFVFFLSTAFAGRGQNLVPNGGFEQYTGCPTSVGQLDYALFWINPAPNTLGGGTPDYFNQCANPSMAGVPANYFGFQNANSGNGYCGIVAGRNDFSYSNWREYIEAELTSILTANTCYHFEMFLNLSNSSQYTSDAMGVYFCDTLINGINNWQPLPYSPQIDFNLGFNTDTVNWINISGNYTASGGEAFIIIGNFKDSSQTNLLLFNTGAIFEYSYFYIDDISLSPCTAIEQNQNEAFSVYPNPAKDELRIKNSGLKIKEINIFDMEGRKVLQQIINQQSSIINIKSLNDGIYFIEIRDGKNVYRKKFLKE